MKQELFWTWRRFTGIILILGGVLFQGSAWGPLSLLTDSNGTFVFSLPPQGALGVIFQHQTLWWWANAFFLGSSIVTLVGLALLTRQLQAAGDRHFSSLGLLLFTIGTLVWAMQLAFRLSIDPWAAQVTATSGMLPDFYVALALWTQVLFVLYTLLAFSGLALYGGAVLSSRLLPQWVGWLAIICGLAGLGLFLVLKDAPPFLHYLLPLLMGSLLMKRSPISTRSQREEEVPAASTATAG